MFIYKMYVEKFELFVIRLIFILLNKQNNYLKILWPLYNLCFRLIEWNQSYHKLFDFFSTDMFVQLCTLLCQKYNYLINRFVWFVKLVHCEHKSHTHTHESTLLS